MHKEGASLGHAEHERQHSLQLSHASTFQVPLNGNLPLLQVEN